MNFHIFVQKYELFYFKTHYLRKIFHSMKQGPSVISFFIYFCANIIIN